MKLPDEVLKYVNNLYDKGVRGNYDHANGCSAYDEEVLSAMFIQSTSVYCLDELNSLIDWGFWGLLADYMKCQDIYSQSSVMNYISEKVVAYYAPKIDQIFKDKEEINE